MTNRTIGGSVDYPSSLVPASSLAGLRPPTQRRIANAHLLHFAAATFLLPNLLLGAGLAPTAAVIVAAGVAASACLLLRDPTRGAALAAPVNWRGLSACIALGFALCLVGGEYHLFFSASDWLIRDFVLADLVKNAFPVFYHHDGADYLLRAPLGMYMAPALIGKIWGLNAAHLALLVQNALLLAVILYLVSLATDAAKPRFLLLMVFFSAMDIVPRIAVDYARSLESGTFEIDPLTMFWNPMFKYWGHIPSLFWVPNHALPGWFFAVALLLHRRGEIDVATLGLACVALLLWSPLAMIGAAPFLALAVAGSGWEMLVRVRNAKALAAALGLVPIIVYLTADAAAVPHEWLVGKDGFWSNYLLLLVFSIPQAWIVTLARAKIGAELETTMALAIALLMLMPLYRLGEGNDMAMRCSIVPLFLLAFGFCEAAPAIMAEGKALALATAAIVSLTAFTGLFEIRRAFVDPAHEISDCNLLTTHAKVFAGFFPSNYLARLSMTPPWLVRDDLSRSTRENRSCWPNYPLLPESAR